VNARQCDEWHLIWKIRRPNASRCITVCGAAVRVENRIKQSHELLIGAGRLGLAIYGFAEGGHLFEQLLESHTGQGFEHWRKLAHNLGDVTREFACAAAYPIAAIDDHHL